MYAPRDLNPEPADQERRLGHASAWRSVPESADSSTLRTKLGVVRAFAPTARDAGIHSWRPPGERTSASSLFLRLPAPSCITATRICARLMSFHIYLRSSSKFWPRSSVGGHKEIELLPELVARTRSFLLGKVVPPKVDRVYNERIRARVHHVVGDEEVKARYRDALERDPPAGPVRNGEVRPGRRVRRQRLKVGRRSRFRKSSSRSAGIRDSMSTTAASANRIGLTNGDWLDRQLYEARPLSDDSGLLCQLRAAHRQLHRT